MAKRGKTPKRMLSLEEQLGEHDANAPTGPKVRRGDFDGELETPSSERMAWAKRRLELVDAIRRRDSKRLDDSGRDASGNFSPSPYAQRGHRVEVAPKEIGKELPKDSQFPKRVTTQRVIDRLKARGTINHTEWLAANALWTWWSQAITGDRVTAAYEPTTVHTSPNTDRLVARRMDAAVQYLVLMALVPYRCRGVVAHVVINDWDLSDWGRGRGFSARHSRRLAEGRLSQGLSALAISLGY